MNGENAHVASVRSWPVRAAGDDPSALRRRCPRIQLDEARGWARTEVRTVGTKAEEEEAARKVRAGNAVGRWPNEALQRIAARWRFC